VILRKIYRLIFNICLVVLSFLIRRKTVKVVPETVKRILIINIYSGFGEMLMSTPMIAETRRIFKHSKIDCLVGSKWSEEVLENNPNLTAVYLRTSENVNMLRKNEYDIVFCLNTGIKNIFFAWGFKHKVLSGIDTNSAGFLLNYKFKRVPRDKIHEVDSYLGVIRSMGFSVRNNIGMEIYLSESEVKSYENKYGDVGSSSDRIVLFASCSENVSIDLLSLKNLSLDKYISLVEHLLTKHEVCLIGGKNDIAFVRKIEDAFFDKSRLKNYCGEFTLRETAIFLKKSRVLITNDSGPMHLAAAVKTKTITFFGPTDYETLMPLVGEHIAIYAHDECRPDEKWTKGNCRPCHLSHFPSTIINCKSRDCMCKIEVGDVLKVI